MSLGIGTIHVRRALNYIGIFRSHFSPRSITASISPAGQVTSNKVTSSNDDFVAAKTLQDVLSSNSLPAIRQEYETLIFRVQVRSILHKLSPNLSASHRVLHELLWMLGRRESSLYDMRFFEKVLKDMILLFDLKSTDDFYLDLFDDLLKSGNLSTARSLLTTLSTAHQVSVALSQGHSPAAPLNKRWYSLLESCSATRNKQMVLDIFQHMKKAGCRQTIHTYRILIVALLQDSPQLAILVSVIGDMSRSGLPYDMSLSKLLYDGFFKHGLFHEAVTIKKFYAGQFRPLLDKQDTSFDGNCQIASRVAEEGIEGGLTLCKLLQGDGFIVTPYTVTILLRNSKNVSDLERVEEALHQRARVMHWSLLIKNCVRSKDLSAALAIYEHSKCRGILPDSPMVHPIISALCEDAVTNSAEQNLSRALDIYRELRDTTATYVPYKMRQSRVTGRWRPKKIIGSPHHSIGPDAPIYRSLLRALGSCGSMSKYSSTVFEVLDDMQSKDIPMDSTLTGLFTVVLVRTATSFSDAFEIYQRIKEREDCRFDAKGYLDILNTFIKLPLGVPPLHMYFQIVRDMREAGHTITVVGYTILLRQLADLAMRMRSGGIHNEREYYDLVVAIRRAHDFLTLDATFSPDTALWNQLMDTYQRAGCFAEAYRLWDMLRITGTFDHTSVSIILDACGFAGSWATAMQTFNHLLDVNFDLNLKNWNTWLECLCRMGKFEDALKTLCLEMGHDGNVAPDGDSVRILLKFSRGQKEEGKIRSFVRRYLPELCKTLPDMTDERRR